MRFLDEHWYRSMQLKGCERDFTIDPRVASDPDGLREEVFPKWYVLAFHWTLEDREGEYDPPVDSDVRERLERYVESRMEYARMTFPDVVPMVNEPDLFAFGYVTQTQYDLIEEVSRYWSSVYDERVRLDKELAEECKHAMGRRMRYFGMHDATVSVTRDGGAYAWNAGTVSPSLNSSSSRMQRWCRVGCRTDSGASTRRPTGGTAVSRSDSSRTVRTGGSSSPLPQPESACTTAPGSR